MIIYIGKNIPPHLLIDLVNQLMPIIPDTIELRTMDNLKINGLPNKALAQQVSDSTSQQQTISLTPTKP